MFLDDILKSSISERFDEAIDSLESKIAFVNTSEYKWSVTISFDLSCLKDADKEALHEMLKYLP